MDDEVSLNFELTIASAINFLCTLVLLSLSVFVNFDPKSEFLNNFKTKYSKLRLSAKLDDMGHTNNRFRG